ncbi:MAG: 17-hydroxy-3-oxo-4-pregnene-20-carboxyl-CoA lyase [Frankiales bacterium]|nr:17-hydroxy-3-oxo-4-pregnene-20-carboxyl-CoA lyase [Frankiales bacterium]
MSFPVADRAAIVGIGQTEYGFDLPRTEVDLAAEAVLAACADAGIDVTDIDGVVRYDVENVRELDLLYGLGVPELRFFVGVASGGGALASTVAVAALAVASGAADVVLTYRSRKRSKRSSYGADPMHGGRPWEKAGARLTGHAQFHHPFGLASPAQEMALIARRHMAVFGTSAEAFGMQAVAQRAHASTNPKALMRDPITLDDWAESRPIAEPLRLLDCSLECDGAVAVVVTSAERATDLRQPPVLVHAAVQGGHPGHYQLLDYFAHAPELYKESALGMATRLWAQSEIVPKDISAAMVFDHFTPAVVLSLEAWGFLPPGVGGLFVADGETQWPDGALPVNTHGGSTSEASIHGFNHWPEAVRQLRGTAVNQVTSCSSVFVCGAITDPSGAVVLRR